MELGGWLAGTAGDMRRWEAAGARGAEVLAWVDVRRVDGAVARVDLWHDPTTSEEWREARCPWVVEGEDGAYSCGIYELRPDVCRAFPELPEQIESMCIRGGVEVRLAPRW